MARSTCGACAGALRIVAGVGGTGTACSMGWAVRATGFGLANGVGVPAVWGVVGVEGDFRASEGAATPACPGCVATVPVGIGRTGASCVTGEAGAATDPRLVGSFCGSAACAVVGLGGDSSRVSFTGGIDVAVGLDAWFSPQC